ncbi:MAG TPA: PHP-associated domain-containing protein [Candidatus Polarisedimenticolia bacterium]|nr:PHP-associated domain-containing protein [Candidatus Polarisedimenticolia bacterium]
MTSFGPIGSDSSGLAAARPFAGQARFSADLHLHSRHSGRGHLRAAAAFALAEPDAIYRVAKGRGADLVTLTDLDTIDGCLEFLDRHPESGDFMISEEVSAREPRGGGSVQVLLYGLSEGQHHEVRRLRADVRDLAEFVRREGIVASLGDVRHRGASRLADEALLRECLGLFGRFEVRNGALGRAHNELMARLAQEAAGGRRFGVTAGSGAHTLRRVGATLTVSRARSVAEFLEDLRAHRTWAIGEDGGFLASSAEAWRTVARGYRALLRGKGPGHTGDGAGRWGRALLALPLDLAGLPIWEVGLQRLRAGARLRAARRRLDRQEITRFKEKAQSYRTAGLASESGSSEPG